MSHDTALIATVAIGLGLAFVFGMLAARLRLPPLVGYLLAGVAVGPFTPGFVADPALAGQLAEIGVILLMFGVGIHFSVGDLLAVRRIAVPGAAVQIAVATILGAVLARFWGWTWGAGLVFGLCLSVASTVVLLRALESRGLLDAVDGRIAVGWLVVEDLATVLVLVLLPAIAPALGGGTVAPDAAAAVGVTREAVGTGLGGLALSLGATLLKVALFVVLVLVVGRRVVPWLLEHVALTGSRELFTLAVLAVALGIAVGAAWLFDVSFALGAFFAGMVVNSSDLSHQAATDALPLQDAFAVLFFVAVGMLFDPAILVEQPLRLLAVVLIILVGKSLGALLIVLALRYPAHTALTISASLAQIGEFSFILAALGVSLGLLPPEGQGLIVAGALVSISLNALMFRLAGSSHAWLRERPKLLELLERKERVEPDLAAQGPALRNHAVLVGHGRVGSVVRELLGEWAGRLVVVERDRGLVNNLRSAGVHAVHGDASRAGVLDRAEVGAASLLVVTAAEPFEVRAIIAMARRANPGIVTIARTHTEDERSWLEQQGVEMVVLGERELAAAMARSAADFFAAVPTPLPELNRPIA
ncbi:MAG: YbaL family putative K(+) efflux transporter [Gemmatimonadales bacterium]